MFSVVAVPLGLYLLALNGRVWSLRGSGPDASSAFDMVSLVVAVPLACKAGYMLTMAMGGMTAILFAGAGESIC